MQRSTYANINESKFLRSIRQIKVVNGTEDISYATIKENRKYTINEVFHGCRRQHLQIQFATFVCRNFTMLICAYVVPTLRKLNKNYFA